LDLIRPRILPRQVVHFGLRERAVVTEKFEVELQFENIVGWCYHWMKPIARFLTVGC
jgi:hypothetical protein